MRADPTEDLLTVADVMARYRLRDRRSARRVMDAAGAFRIGAGLFVRFSDLLDLEERQRRLRRGAPAGTAPSPARRPVPHRPLAPGWWREDDSSRAA